MAKKRARRAGRRWVKWVRDSIAVGDDSSSVNRTKRRIALPRTLRGLKKEG